MKVHTREQILERVSYDEVTGLLTWRDRPRDHFATERGWKSFRTQCAGKIASATTVMGPNTYRVIRIDNKLYLQHRLVWLIVTGDWPVNLLDHRNGDGLNNRPENLREATAQQNQANRAYGKRTASGLKGAYSLKNGRYTSKIALNGKYKNLGCFATALEAHEAYVAAARQIHGEFARAA